MLSYFWRHDSLDGHLSHLEVSECMPVHSLIGWLVENGSSTVVGGVALTPEEGQN